MGQIAGVEQAMSVIRACRGSATGKATASAKGKRQGGWGGARAGAGRRPAPKFADFDPNGLDPEAVLRQIAASGAAPASARVAACKALMAGSQQQKRVPEPVADELSLASARAIALLAGGEAVH
jgi:hypothetical protein